MWPRVWHFSGSRCLSYGKGSGTLHWKISKMVNTFLVQTFHFFKISIWTATKSSKISPGNFSKVFKFNFGSKCRILAQNVLLCGQNITIGWIHITKTNFRNFTVRTDIHQSLTSHTSSSIVRFLSLKIHSFLLWLPYFYLIFILSLPCFVLLCAYCLIIVSNTRIS